MAITTISLDIENKLLALGFARAGASSTYTRRVGPSNYEISCAVGPTGATTLVDYGPLVRIGRATTCNLGQPESFAVLDCVCRLLNQGFPAQAIELEKPYKVGHEPKYLDILVTRDGAAYLMIECKTYPAEYVTERARLQRDGGQVLTYFAQDRSAEWLVVYSTQFALPDSTPRYLGLCSQGLTGSNTADLYASWDKETFETGLFEAPPYAFKQPTLHVRDLEDMRREDGGRIFNEFEEILRRHVVSDKPNAFNKIFNLFICKVFDEQKADPDDELDFQWRRLSTAHRAARRT